MSHHFDTPSAREDPRLNLCDLYLFAGIAAETTVMAMTVNPAATAATSAPFRDEAVYAFRFDTDDDSGEDVSFKVRFDGVTGAAPVGVAGADVQSFQVYRAEHGAGGLDGDLVASGVADGVVRGPGKRGVRAFAGVVLDAFAGDAVALEGFKAAFADGRYEPRAFGHRVNFFQSRKIGAIVLELPNELIGNNVRVNAWATVSLCGHAPEQQVSRWGLPLFTHIYLGDDELREKFNRTTPSDDNDPFRDGTIATVSRYVEMAGTTADPQAYAQRVAALFGSLTLPYELGTVASFDYAGFNGRGLSDNVMDNMLSLLTNSPLGTGIAPDPARFSHAFPYLRPVSDGDDQ